jgi:protein required for attachment to host cells
MLLRSGTLIAVADGKNFTLFWTEGHGLVPRLQPAGRPHVEGNNHSAGSRHRSTAANPDEKQDAEDMHAAATAGWLNRAAIANSFDQAVVIAPPRMLGELRKHYHKVLESKIVKEIPKDLTGQDKAQIEAALEQA